MTHDDKRHGTTTLFVAFNVLDGTVIGGILQRHRHQAFVRFLKTINARVPDDKAVLVILTNYAAYYWSPPDGRVRFWIPFEACACESGSGSARTARSVSISSRRAIRSS